MATNTSKKLKTQLVFSITLIISLVAVVATASFAWFVNRDDNSVDTITVYVANVYNLQIVGETDDNVSSNVKENFYLKPVYGDAHNFFVPEYKSTEVVEGSGVYDDLPTGDYLNIDAQIKDYIFVMEFALSITKQADIYLEYSQKGRTGVVGASGSQGRKSPYGDFSRDEIIGAVRVAIFEEETLKMIWIPNTKTQLSQAQDGTYTLTKDGQVEESFSFMRSDKTTFSVQTQGQANGNVEIDGVIYVWGDITADNSPKITTMLGQKNFKVIAWIDGMDRECTNALVGGRINVNLGFTAQEIVQN